MSELHEIYDLESLKTALLQGFKPRFKFFWGHKAHPGGQVTPSCFSQWWPSAFFVDGVRYATAEHYMMAGKARLFGDHEMLERILLARSPAEAKRLGRQVQGFDGAKWDAARQDIVVVANLAKFTQNPELGVFLAATKDRILVEASPHDKIWGIGLAESDPKAHSPEQWRGLNLLGFALMKVRKQL